MEKVKKHFSKKNSAPINSTPLDLSNTSSLNNATHIIVARKPFDDDQTPLIFLINCKN